MKTLLHLTCALSTAALLSCSSQSGQSSTATEINTPPSHLAQILADSANILGEVQGDLNKDGLNERVIVYNTDEQGDFGTARKLFIYSFTDGDWQLMHESSGPVLPSEHGGAMGDPFESVAIERGCIVLYHSGGSRTRWSYTHRYRLQQDDWYLIGSTIGFGEPPCTWDTYDYNLSSGSISVKKEQFTCEEPGYEQEKSQTYETIHKLDSLPRMDGFQPGEHLLKLNENKDTFYF